MISSRAHGTRSPRPTWKAAIDPRTPRLRVHASTTGHGRCTAVPARNEPRIIGQRQRSRGRRNCHVAHGNRPCNPRRRQPVGPRLRRNAPQRAETIEGIPAAPGDVPARLQAQGRRSSTLQPRFRRLVRAAMVTAQCDSATDTVLRHASRADAAHPILGSRRHRASGTRRGACLSISCRAVAEPWTDHDGANHAVGTRLGD